MPGRLTFQAGPLPALDDLKIQANRSLTVAARLRKHLTDRPMNEWITLQFDGGSRGNPGPSGIGVVLSAEDGTPLVTLGRFIGQATNNIAEYRGLITALEQAKKLGATKIIIRGDSELIIRQMLGQYKVRHPNLKPLYEQARALLREFPQSRIEHNLREKNELADKLANLAMDRRIDVTDV